VIWLPFPWGKEASFSTIAFFPTKTWCLRTFMRQWFAEVTYWSYVAFIKWTHAMKYSTVGPVCEPTCSMWIEQVWIAPSRYVTNELAVFAMCMLLQVRYYTVHKVMFQCLRVHSWHMSLLLKPNIYSTWGEWKQSLYVAQDRALAYTVIHDTPFTFTPLMFYTPLLLLHYRCACTVFTGSGRRWDLSVQKYRVKSICNLTFLLT